jgi:hypothetical protein
MIGLFWHAVSLIWPEVSKEYLPKRGAFQLAAFRFQSLSYLVNFDELYFVIFGGSIPDRGKAIYEQAAKVKYQRSPIKPLERAMPEPFGEDDLILLLRELATPFGRDSISLFNELAIKPLRQRQLMSVAVYPDDNDGGRARRSALENEGRVWRDFTKRGLRRYFWDDSLDLFSKGLISVPVQFEAFPIILQSKAYGEDMEQRAEATPIVSTPVLSPAPVPRAWQQRQHMGPALDREPDRWIPQGPYINDRSNMGAETVSRSIPLVRQVYRPFPQRVDRPLSRRVPLRQRTPLSQQLAFPRPLPCPQLLPSSPRMDRIRHGRPLRRSRSI